MSDDGSVCLISSFSVSLCLNEISVGSIQKNKSIKIHLVISVYFLSLKALKVIKKTEIKKHKSRKYFCARTIISSLQGLINPSFLPVQSGQ